MKYYPVIKRINFKKINRKKYYDECSTELLRQVILDNMSKYALHLMHNIKVKRSTNE